MYDPRLESLVSRLEVVARDHPRRYLTLVLAVSLLGLIVVLVAVFSALLPAVLLLGLLLLVITKGGAALLLFLKLGKLIVLLVVPAWVMLKSSFQMLFTRFPRPEGRRLTEQDAPGLFKRIAELRSRLHGPAIHHILLTDELNAAIVQHPRFGLFGFEENYLILGFPLLQIVSEEEALAIVAHEYGHLSGRHGRLSGLIYRLRSTGDRLQQLSAQWESWLARLIARLFNWYVPIFNAYTFVLARQNEYVADQLSAEIAGTRNTANALMRVNIASQFESEVFWPGINRLIADNPEPISSRSHFWVEAIHAQLDETCRTRYMDIAGKCRTDHLDTHPAIRDRLLAIAVEVDEDAARQLLPPVHSAAEIWMGAALPVIQQEFDQLWQNTMSERWKERHQFLSECKEKLSQLEARENLTEDESWEAFIYKKELSPDLEELPLLNQFLLDAPDHGQAHYQRGMILLKQENEAGIADLEIAMKQDPDCTLSACELAWQFYLERDPPRAHQYRERWVARSEHERKVNAEYHSLSADATLTAHDLEDTQLESIRELVKTHGKYLRSAYLLRRTLKSDPTIHDYVLAFETKRFTLGDKGPEVVKLLAEQEFPFHTFIVHLGSQPYKRFRKEIKRLQIAPIL